MRVASEGLLVDVYQRFLRGSLARLALHPSANFVVQAYLAALHGSQQVLAVCSMHVHTLHGRAGLPVCAAWFPSGTGCS